jgi:Xaa-Pro aminopeptidase
MSTYTTSPHDARRGATGCLGVSLGSGSWCRSGQPRLRGNSQEYRFRPSSDYVYLTGDQVAGGVLVLEPDAGEHHATLFVRPPSDPGTIDFFQSDRHGELWVGPRPSLAEVEAAAGIPRRPLGELTASLDPSVATRVRRGIDAEVDALVARPIRTPTPSSGRSSLSFVSSRTTGRSSRSSRRSTQRSVASRTLSVPSLRRSRRRRAKGRRRVRAARPHRRERRPSTIAASGAHATTLHWTRNDGLLQPEELLLWTQASRRARSMRRI